MPSPVGYNRAAVKLRRTRQSTHRVREELQQTPYRGASIVKGIPVAGSPVSAYVGRHNAARNLWDVQTAIADWASHPHPRPHSKTPEVAAGRLNRNDAGHQYELEQECADLKARNDELTSELRNLRSIVARRFGSREKPDARGAQHILESHNRTAAAEMLVEIGESKSDMLFEILAKDRQPLESIIVAFGAIPAMRCISLLGNCHAALVDGEEVARTEFGSALYNWLLTLDSEITLTEGDH